MPLLFAFLLGPRLTAFVLWLATGWLRGVYDSAALAVLGFIFVPWTTLWVAVVAHWTHGTWGNLQIIGLVVALLLDLSSARSPQSPRQGAR